MRRHTIPLGRLFGIPLELDFSWFLIFALMTWMLAVSYFPLEFANWPQGEYWFVGAITAVMLFVSVVLHELGHSIVARRFQIIVRRITLFVFGGVSDIATELSCLQPFVRIISYISSNSAFFRPPLYCLSYQRECEHF